jgi:hypothetical protein
MPTPRLFVFPDAATIRFCRPRPPSPPWGTPSILMPCPFCVPLILSRDPRISNFVPFACVPIESIVSVRWNQTVPVEFCGRGAMKWWPGTGIVNLDPLKSFSGYRAWTHSFGLQVWTPYVCILRRTHACLHKRSCQDEFGKPASCIASLLHSISADNLMSVITSQIK